MSAHKKDTSCLEQYREEYEAGMITQVEIQKVTNISKRPFDRYIKNNNWSVELASENRCKLKRLESYKKIQEYKNDYENGLISIVQISKKLKMRSTIVSSFAKEQGWDASKNEEKRILTAKSNLKPLTAEQIQMGGLATKKRWERLHSFSKNLKKGDIVNVKGKTLYWGGFKHNRAKLYTGDLIYSKYTYTDAEIIKIEKKMQKLSKRIHTKKTSTNKMRTVYIPNRKREEIPKFEKAN